VNIRRLTKEIEFVRTRSWEYFLTESCLDFLRESSEMTAIFDAVMVQNMSESNCFKSFPILIIQGVAS
jgi:hypothetical protein